MIDITNVEMFMDMFYLYTCQRTYDKHFVDRPLFCIKMATPKRVAMNAIDGKAFTYNFTGN